MFNHPIGNDGVNEYGVSQMTDFKENMMTELEAYKTAMAADQPTKAKKTGKSVTKYECEASGIDLVVSRIVNEKCTMKLCAFLSQSDDSGEPMMFIKTMKDGTMRKADSDNVNTFLRELDGPMRTGSNAIPTIKNGKAFANQLMRAKETTYVSLIKEGLLNTDLLEENHGLPWYVSDGYHATGRGISDKHAKLIRHMVSELAERDGIEYSEALTRTCGNGHRYYTNDGTYQFVWAFSMLADLFDEPFATRCFDEYIDNHRLGGLTVNSVSSLVTNLVRDEDYYYRGLSWKDAVTKYRNGSTIVNLDKNRFWEFVQQSVAVGLGKKLDSYLNLYGDYLRQAYFCDGKVKEKYPENLQVVHDVYSEKYTTIKEFKDNEKLKARVEKGKAIIDQTHDGYQLRTLMSVNDFLEEARQNCNCVASYVDSVIRGKCWVASFRPIGAASTQLTIEVNPDGDLVQIKGRYNRNPTEAELNLLTKFRTGIKEKMKEQKA